MSRRSSGKRIRDSITTLAYIQWSEDGQTVFYRNMELAFSGFIRAEVEQTQALLENLFLLSHDEQRSDVVPVVALHRLRDNPAVTESGWAF